MLKTAFHWGVLARFAPNLGKIKVVKERLMDLHDTIIHFCTASSRRENNWLIEVWCKTSSFGVNSHHAESVPDLLEENIETKLITNWDTSCKRVLRYTADLLYRNLINLVVNIKAFNVFSIALNDINKLINIIVTPESHVSIMNLILMQYILNEFFITAFGLFNLGVELNSSSFSLLDY